MNDNAPDALSPLLSGLSPQLNTLPVSPAPHPFTASSPFAGHYHSTQSNSLQQQQSQVNQSMMSVPGVHGGMPRVPSVGNMPMKLGNADELDAELYDIFSMASNSFETDAPNADYFSHAFPSQQQHQMQQQQQQQQQQHASHSQHGVSRRASAHNTNMSMQNSNNSTWNPSTSSSAAATSGMSDANAFMQPMSSQLTFNPSVTGSSSSSTSSSSLPPLAPNSSAFPPLPSSTASSNNARSGGPPAGLTVEQQQRLYADFIAGRNVNSFNPQFQFQPSHPLHSGAGGAHSESDYSDSDDDAPAPTRKKGGKNVKIESTPASAHFNSPYYKPGSTPVTSAAAGASSGGPPGNGDENDGDRLGKRLARKAELARASRRRKKMYVQDLESKVKKLGAVIEELQGGKAGATGSAGGKPGHSAADEESARREAQQQIRATLSDLLARHAADPSDATITAQIQALVGRFVTNSRERQARVETHLDKVEESLTPGLQAKFTLWGLDQPDEFYTRPGLWSSLMSGEIGLNQQQLQTILSKRAAIHEERQRLAQCEAMIRELRASSSRHLRSLHEIMDEIQGAMTPTQLAQFCLWVDNNQWTLAMLDSAMFATSKTQQQP